MAQVEAKIRNFKLIKALDATLKSGNVYIVSGSNKTGKTTFTQAVEALLNSKLPKDPLSHKAPGGLIDGIITNKNGETYRVSIDLKKGKAPGFSIVKPDLSVSKRKTDLAHIFNYQNIQPETFMALGSTEGGRKQQAELLTSLMTIEIKKELNSLDRVIDSDYESRKEIGILMKNEPGAVEPTKEQTTIAVNAGNWKTDYNKRVEEYNKVNSNLSLFNNLKIQIKSEIEVTQNRIDKLNEDLKLEENILLQTEEKLKEHLETNVSEEDVEFLKKSLVDDQEAVEEAVRAADVVEKFTIYDSKVKTWSENYDKLTNNIQINRQLKKDLVAENIPIDGIMIDNGQLYYIDGEEAFPFDETSLSYSRGILTVAKMILFMNPMIPIVCVGKSAELDNNSVKELISLAKERDAIVVLDYVTQEDSPLSINVIEETEEIKEDGEKEE